MKYCIIIPDGSADLPLKSLGGKTPLQAAAIPNMDRAAREGLLGLVSSIPKRMEPGSDVAVMNLLGYDPAKYYTGRAPLEAADLGIRIDDNQWAFRCNFVTVENNLLRDFSAGHISTGEADELIVALNRSSEDGGCRFFTGTGYRHLMLYTQHEHMDITAYAPHQVMGQPLSDIRPAGAGSGKLFEIMEYSRSVLENHPVNLKRIENGLPPANMIWLWGHGRRTRMEPFAGRFNIRGAAISAVNLVRGIAKLIGWDIIDVPGITGYLDTDYGAKGTYAIAALERYDLVTIHIEAPDEASHEGDIGAKIEAIEQIDRHIIGPVMASGDGGLRVLILPDHITSSDTGRHLTGRVPAAIWGCGIRNASGLSFTEAKAGETDILWDKGFELMPSFLKE